MVWGGDGGGGSVGTTPVVMVVIMVSVSAVALAVMVVVLYGGHRRGKKVTGSYTSIYFGHDDSAPIE